MRQGIGHRIRRATWRARHRCDCLRGTSRVWRRARSGPWDAVLLGCRGSGRDPGAMRLGTSGASRALPTGERATFPRLRGTPRPMPPTRRGVAGSCARRSPGVCSPKNARSGAFSASTIFRIAEPNPVGLGLTVPARAAAMPSCTGAYCGWASAKTADAPLQSVSKPPGSTRVTLIPNPATSWARDSLGPSSAHFEAW